MREFIPLLFLAGSMLALGWAVGYHIGWRNGFNAARWIIDLKGKKLTP